MVQYCKPLLYVYLGYLLLTFASCRKPGSKVIARFKDSTVAVIYEYPDLRDTSTYTYLEYFPKNGRVRARIPVVYNKIVNFPQRMYPSGKIYEVDSALNPYDRYSSLWNGRITRFYENGKKWAEFPVENGIIQGLVTYFDSTGHQSKRYSVTNNVIKNGTYEEYYPNGKISVKANFSHNLLTGMMYYFNMDGDTTKYCFYDSGQIYLPYKKWLADGKTLVGTYTDASGKSLIWKWYARDGKEIKKQRMYSKDKSFVAPE